MSNGKAKYEPLETGDGSDNEANGYSQAAAAQLAAARKLERRARIMLYASIGLVVIAACLLFGLPVLRRTPSELECAQVVSPYSTIWDSVEFWEGDFENEFAHESKYRGPPTLDREVAWDELWNVPALAVDTEGLRLLNRTNPEDFYPLNGSDPANPTYGGVAEVFHQLHCLNVIRQYTWPLKLYNESWGELYPGVQEENPVLARMHVDHCIETLRLCIMCYADITPVMTLKVDDDFDRNPDFNVHHKCRDFDKILARVWKDNYDIPDPPSATRTPSVDRS